MLISIIIPTRERSEFLSYSLQTALEIEDENVEIIVSDNCSEDDTETVVKGFEDPRLRYVRTDRRVSMRQNFQFALDRARGEYVMFFGDDDGILPRQFAAMRKILEAERPDGLTWSLFTFTWPLEQLFKKSGGIRFRPKTCFGGIEEIETRQKMKDMEACTMRDFAFFPRVYHGVASTDYLRRAANEEGVFFCSSSPDIYFSFRACHTGGRFLFSHHPFSVNGHGSKSTGGSHGARSRDDKRSLSAEKFKTENKEDPLADVIPATLSVRAALFATVESIRERFPQPELRPDYRRWYRFVLNDITRRSEEIVAEASKLIRDHAKRTGTETELDQAEKAPQKSEKTPKDRWDRLVGNFTSIRLSAESNGENNILTAVHMCDDVLGENYAEIIDGNISQRAAWSGLRKRSKKYRRTV